MRFCNKIFLLILLFAITGGACGKKENRRYEEDPEFSKSSPSDRIRGHWLLDDFTFNGASIVSKFNGSFSKRKDTFGKAIDIRNSSITASDVDGKRIVNVNLPVFTIAEGTFDEDNILVPVFIHEGNDSVANMSVYSPMHFKDPNILPQDATWKITKLFDDNLNIVFETDSGQYKMLFSKQ